ncbi:hypothetical protein BpHYR1_035308 [Brachionus plicatilis]|uniref:Uncharacterized protein n=1 Tax=Brachionus plicatilis TaxID=10195 RepID=A0A3M7QP98_BRAPC|nr:hypothetical protein BpHYR1_035308 [Brachionus plicatilis]
MPKIVPSKFEQIRQNEDYCENFYNENYLTINPNEEFNYADYQNQFIDAYSYYQANGQDYTNCEEYAINQNFGFQTNIQDQYYANQDNYQEAFYHYQNFSNAF